jgi:hypothetical protein
VPRRPLDVIRSTDVRSAFNAALRPELKKLGFKRAKGGPSGWAREQPPLRDFFWIQFSSFGFFRDIGGKFVVEFEFQNAERGTSIRDRMWRLLDDASRREVVRLNNQAIKALPGPLPEIYGQLSSQLDQAHRQNFDLITEIPPVHSDVWFRYATRENVGAWAAFLASRLDGVVIANEERLSTLPNGAAVFLGTMRRRGEEKWTTLEAYPPVRHS